MRSWTFGLTPSGLPIELEQVARGGIADGRNRTSGLGPAVKLLGKVQQFPLGMPRGCGIVDGPHAAEFPFDQPDFPVERIGRGIRQPPVPLPEPRSPIGGSGGPHSQNRRDGIPFHSRQTLCRIPCLIGEWSCIKA